MIKVLIVDDSAFMRKVISDLFTDQPDFAVIGTARNGLDAIEKTRKLKPDLITMDVEMPVMDGLAALQTIMTEFPAPVIMVSSLTHQGTTTTLRALELGAVDFVTKNGGPISDIKNIKNQILEKSRSAVQANIKSLAFKQISDTKPVTIKPSVNLDKIIAIGTSTGGPRALQEIITRLPYNLPAGVVIVQHMPAGFTRSLAERLNSISSLTVKEAQHNDIVKPGLVLIAPGDYHMIVQKENKDCVVKLNQNPQINGHRPSVNPLMDSVAHVYGPKAVGVLLTGMGQDGAKGIQSIKKQGGYTIAEDNSTAVVFGMPKAAIELGVVDSIVPLYDMPTAIVKSIDQ